KAVFEGDELTIQSILDEWGEFGRILGGVIDYLEDVINLLGAIFRGDAGTIDKILDDWGAFGEIIRGIVEGIEKIREFFKIQRDNATTREVESTPGYGGFSDPGSALLF